MTILESVIKAITPQSSAYRDKAHERLAQLTMPFWALGRLMDLAVDLAGMTKSMAPPVARRSVVVFAGDHGVVKEGVSKYPQEVTCQMVRNFVNGGAGINAISRVVGAKVIVVDMGTAAPLDDLVKEGKVLSRRIGPGTKNMAAGPAMTREEALASVEAGIGVALKLADDTDIFATGEMGIGNTTPSSAITAVLTKQPAAKVTGRGTGLEEPEFHHKIEVIERALALNKPCADDPLDVLAKVGGFEIGGIAGLILGAASLRKPVLLDGFISTAGGLVAHALCQSSAEFMIASHRSVEQGHSFALSHLGKTPLLDLDLRLGEGTGAALAMSLVEASVRILTEVATFEEAAVSGALG
uniref:Nicotinate-nucleotide--dimethylbenzimidazole phosphoribosyltransferase n=1 Tax=Desulfomonile tiedjei TaxID=2358 RepID=A0A7C4ETQ9_9BACT